MLTSVTSSLPCDRREFVLNNADVLGFNLEYRPIPIMHEIKGITEVNLLDCFSRTCNLQHLDFFFARVLDLLCPQTMLHLIKELLCFSPP